MEGGVTSSVLGGKNSREKKWASSGRAAILSVIFSMAVVGVAVEADALNLRGERGSFVADDKRNGPERAWQPSDESRL